MDLNELLNVHASVLLIAYIIPLLLSEALYLKMAGFPREPIGRAWVLKDAILIVIIAMYALTLNLGPDYPYRGLIRFVLFSGVNLIGYYTVFVLYKLYKSTR